MKAKFSFSDLFKDSWVALNRFPIVILLSVIGAVLAIVLGPDSNWGPNITSLITTLGLGISLFFALSLFAEINQLNWKKRLAILLLGIGILAFVYFDLNSEKSYYRFEQNVVFIGIRYGILFHLMVAFLPLWGKSNNLGFWHYNRTLLTRIILTGIFISVSYLGLAAAISAVNILFALSVSSKVFYYLWVILFGPISVIFFCAGIPKNFEELDFNEAFLNILKVFVQFVLIPLILIYLGIMYVYFGKIIIQWTLPKGFLTMFINAMWAVGILAYLLIHPFQTVSNNRFIQFYCKFFFKFLIPVVIMQFVGIFTRIGQYGITEDRYMVLITAIWISVLILYFEVFKKSKISAIPFSMFLFVVMSVWGPLSAKKVTIWSQKNQIQQLIKELKMVDGEKIVAYGKSKNNSLNITKSEELYEKIRFLVDNYGITGLEPKLNIITLEQAATKLENKKLDRWDMRYQVQNIQRDSLNSLMQRLNLSSGLGAPEMSTYNQDITADSVASTTRIFLVNKMESMKIPKGVTTLTKISFNGYAEKSGQYSVKVIDKYKFQIVKSGITYTFNMFSVMNKELGDELTNYIFESEEGKGRYKFIADEIEFDSQLRELELFSGILCE